MRDYFRGRQSGTRAVYDWNGARVLDIGANAGISAVYFAASFPQADYVLRRNLE